MANLGSCKNCGTRCARIKRNITKLMTCLVCSRCHGMMEGMVEKTVNGFCYLGDMLITSGGCEIAVTVRVSIS